MAEVSEQRRGISRRRVLALGCGAVVATGAVLWWRRQPPDYPGGKLSVAEAHARAHAGEITLIDIRTPREWKATGLPDGSHPIDMRRKDFVTALGDITGPDRDQPIALICARGVRSARLSLRLSAAGYSNIIDVPEGMLGSRAGPGWLARDLPVQPWQDAEG